MAHKACHASPVQCFLCMIRVAFCHASRLQHVHTGDIQAAIECTVMHNTPCTFLHLLAHHARLVYCWWMPAAKQVQNMHSLGWEIGTGGQGGGVGGDGQKYGSRFHLGHGGSCMGGPDRKHQDRSSWIVLPQLCNNICRNLTKTTMIIHKALEALQSHT